MNLLSVQLLLIHFVFSVFAGRSQPPQFKIYTYIETYSLIAIQQMAEYKIPASVTLAQAIYESSSGTSDLAKKSNNHFGIKCHTNWSGDTVVKNDDTLNECFRRYAHIKESYIDHSLFLTGRLRYASLFELNLFDYKSWCIGLKEAGYATSATYAQQLIKIIENHRLFELDSYEYLSQEFKKISNEPEPKYSKYTGIGFSVKDFCKSGALMLDDKSFDLKILDKSLATEKKDATAIAGN